jgi:hypothetical protein
MKTYYIKPIAYERHAEDVTCPDGGWKPMGKKEKMILSKLAASAAQQQGLELTAKELAEWRAAESVKACGVRISAASHEQWPAIKAHFEKLGGKVGKALVTHVRGGDNKRRVALWKLQTVLTEKGLAMGYAEKICQMQYKVPLKEATAKQLWRLFFTVTNRKNPQQKTA